MTRLIKKYKNRRLYDTEISRYITIEEVQQYVMDGLAFKVEDSSTQKDLTNATLLQILVDMEGGPSQFLSADLLRQLIWLAGHPMNQLYKTWLEQFVSTIQNHMQLNAKQGDYQKMNEAWSKELQKMTSFWQTLFRQ